MCIDCRGKLLQRQGSDIAVIESILVLAQTLGVVQRPVGSHKQIKVSGTVVRGKGGADRAAQGVGLEIGPENGAEGRNQLGAAGLHQITVGDILHQHQEFVAADTGHHIGGPEQPTDFFGTLGQHRVAYHMSVLVVDMLEVVQIDDHQHAIDAGGSIVQVLGYFFISGLLVQQLDTVTKSVTADMCVTETKPTEAQLVDLNFGWRVVKHVKSNAIAVVKDGHTLGVGAGQMNRVGSAEIALKQAQAAGFTEGLVLASDGFLPFDDTVAFAAQYGVTAIVQPGGSIRDDNVIETCNNKGIAMAFTKMRLFHH